MVTHISTQTHNRLIDWLTQTLRLLSAFSISTIFIPSLELPQPIQTAAILNGAIHAMLPTESHYCASWPQLSPANNRPVTTERKQLRFFLKKYHVCNITESWLANMAPVAHPYQLLHPFICYRASLSADSHVACCASKVCVLKRRWFYLCVL